MSRYTGVFDMIIRREDFGNIKELSNGSHKKIWFICEKCGIGILQAYRNYNQQKSGKFCRPCRNKHTANRPDVKEKQSQASKKKWKDPEHRKHMSEVLQKACKKAWDQDDGTRRKTIHNKISYNEIKEIIEKEGFKLLTTISERGNVGHNIEIECKRGHKFKTSMGRWNSGIRCNKCQKVMFSKIQNSFSEEGYTLLINEEDYINNAIKMPYICPLGHKHHITWSNWILGHRCGKCSSHISKGEYEIQNYIQSLASDMITNDRIIIKPLELDIVIPSKKLAIEYCGLFWHSEQKGKDKNYHLNKFNMCKEKGYRLITIFEDEWYKKKNVVKNKLKHILNKGSDGKIYARKCKIYPVQTTEAKIFIDKFHIQGYITSSIRLGAYHENKLVAVMTFTKQEQSDIWELNKFSTSCNITGIAEKLLEYFKRNYEWNEIYSFVDKRWSNGNLYRKMSFEELEDTEPNCWYFYQKSFYKEYKRILDIFNPMDDWYKIWDCGNYKFVMRRD